MVDNIIPDDSPIMNEERVVVMTIICQTMGTRYSCPHYVLSRWFTVNRSRIQCSVTFKFLTIVFFFKQLFD